MCFHMKTLGRRSAKRPQRDTQALMVNRIKMLQNRPTGRSVHNGSVIPFGADQRTVEAWEDDAIGSPISMFHYTQNIQSLLTRRFNILHMIFKSEFGVKNETKEFCFFHYFYRRFSQKNVRFWGENPPALLMKVSENILSWRWRT